MNAYQRRKLFRQQERYIIESYEKEKAESEAKINAMFDKYMAQSGFQEIDVEN